MVTVERKRDAAAALPRSIAGRGVTVGPQYCGSVGGRGAAAVWVGESSEDTRAAAAADWRATLREFPVGACDSAKLARSAAGRVCLRIVCKSGKVPSDTTRAEAEGAAAAAVWAIKARIGRGAAVWWRSFRRDALTGAEAEARLDLKGRLFPRSARRSLWLAAWRAAFASVDSERRGMLGGRTPDARGAWRGAESLDALLAAGWDVAFEPGEDTEAEASTLSKRVAVRFMRAALRSGVGGGRGGAAARAQCRVLCYLVAGAEWAEAARRAGFASGKQAAESFRGGKVWDKLARFAALSPGARAERGRVRAAGLRAAAAVKAARAAAVGLRIAGAGAVKPRVARLVSGASSVQPASLPRRAGVFALPVPFAAMLRGGGERTVKQIRAAHRSQVRDWRGVFVKRPAVARMVPARGVRGMGAGQGAEARAAAAALDRRAAAVDQARAARAAASRFATVRAGGRVVGWITRAEAFRRAAAGLRRGGDSR